MTNRHSETERVMALSGLVQAAFLVSNIARSGMVSQTSLESSLNSIFVTNPANTLDVYEGTAGIATGIRVAGELFEKFNIESHVDVVRYVLALIQLERKVSRYPEKLRAIGAGISLIDEKRNLNQQIDTQSHDQGDAQDNDQRNIQVHAQNRRRIDQSLVSELAALYETELGVFDPRINILGKENHLKNDNNISRIRALLLSGIRSAVLWHQLGGRRWQLLLTRRSVHQALKRLKYC